MPSEREPRTFTGDPWGMQPFDTSRSFYAFTLYRDMPSEGRTLLETARRMYGRDISEASGGNRTVTAWAGANRWAERVRLWDEHLDAIRRSATERERADLGTLAADVEYLTFGLVRRSVAALAEGSPLNARETAVIMNAASRLHAVFAAAGSEAPKDLADELDRLRRARSDSDASNRRAS